MSASRVLQWWAETRLKQLVRPSHPWWHFSNQSLVSHYVMTFFYFDQLWKMSLTLSWQIPPETKSSSTVMIRGDPQLKQLLRPSHAWWHCVQPTLGLVTWARHFQMVIVTGDICGAYEWFQATKWAWFFVLFDPTDHQNHAHHAHFVAWDHTSSIFQECHDYHRQKMS